MTSNQRNRLRSALYLSIADLFFGAAAVIIVLVVFATRTEVARYPQIVDFVVGCKSGPETNWVVENTHGEPKREQSIEDWLQNVQPKGLMAKVGVLTPPNALDCYIEVEKAVLAHNRQLTTRSGEGGVISTVFLPEIADD